MATAPRDRNGFYIAIFCALPLEAENVQSVFDICWEDQNKQYGKAPGDQNAYTTGVIGKHNVVLVHMPSMGNNSAALAAAGLRSSFLEIKLALVVGICGVVPVHPKTKKEIILGDVIISTAVVQYDFGRQYPGGFKRKNEVEDSLGRASPEIRAFVNMLATRQNRERFNRKLEQLVNSKEFRNENPAATYPGVIHDRLYQAAYIHRHQADITCDKCLPNTGTCSRYCDELGCEDNRLVTREKHSLDGENSIDDEGHTPCMHLGRFGSANTVMKSGVDRDRIATADDMTAFEMEGAGVWEQHPTIVIKAACDYADSHKNKKWQDYAAAMAAACLKVFLKEWIISDQLSNRDELIKPVWHIPFALVPGFVGREHELETLEQKLLDPDSRRIVSLLGLGGVGKSRLALELSYQIKSKYPQYSVFWVQASDQLTFEKNVLEIGKKLGIQGVDDEKADVKTLLKQHLNLPSTKNWLLVLDNADDEALWGRRSNPRQPEFSMVDHLPNTINGSILITTRTRRVASFLTEKEVINLDTMTQGEAAELFVSRLEQPDSAADRYTLLILVDKLVNLPLAIIQAASYVNMTAIPLQTYLNLLDKPETEIVKLLSEDFGDASRYPNAINPVASTWLMSFEQIQKRHALAANFLSAIACPHEKGTPPPLLPKVESEIDNIEALAVLIGYSFMTKQNRIDGVADGEELYNVHQLVQLAARGWLKEKGIFNKWTKICTIRLARLFPSRDHKYKRTRTMYLPHAQRLCEEDGIRDLAERYDLLEQIGSGFVADGKYDEAVRIHSAVVQWREHTSGISDKMTLTAYENLGEALSYQGKFSAAETYLRTAMNSQITVLGKIRPSMMSIMSKLASVLHDQGKYIEAEGIYRETLQLRQTVLGKNHPETLTSMNNLAIVLSDQGKYTEAETMYRETLQLTEMVLGKGHPETLTSMNNLASVLGGQGKYIEAETMCRETLQLKETVLGKSHPDMLISVNNLAIVLSDQGKYTEAETMYRETLQLRQTVLGKSHPRTLISMNNLASVLGDQGKYKEAETMYRKTLQLRETVLGKSHPETLTSINNLACNLKRQNRTREAVKLMRSCTEQFVAVLGPTHPHSQTALNTLTDWLSIECSVEQEEEVAERQIPGSRVDQALSEASS